MRPHSRITTAARGEAAPALETTHLAKLHELNEGLRLVTEKIKALGLAKTRELMAQREANGRNMCDFHLSAWVSYVAKTDPNDIHASGDYEGLYGTGIRLDFTIPGSASGWEGDMEFFYDRPDVLGDMNPIWLMHELYKPGDDGKPPVTLQECLKIDSIEVAIITTEKYVFDLPTKLWLKDAPFDDECLS